MAVAITSADPKRTLYNRVNAVIANYEPANVAATQRLFTLGRVDALKALLQGAAFQEVTIASVRHRFEFESFDAFFGPVRQGLGSVGQLFRRLAPEAQKLVQYEVFGDVLGVAPDGPFAIEMEVLIGSGRC